MGDAGEDTSESTQTGKDEDEDEAKAHNQGEGIMFLPGILIHGHDWSFITGTPTTAAHPDDKGQGSGDGHGREIKKPHSTPRYHQERPRLP
ncbi:hypothetical protein QQX98_000317 [Neonectria punicea]|uniref:Uncharacterized protein n=1 Tax=Neonectria punicea TaxID=979145 RepID=A0ABR1HUU2_9HYPO